jgi:hypothetical protein
LPLWDRLPVEASVQPWLHCEHIDQERHLNRRDAEDAEAASKSDFRTLKHFSLAYSAFASAALWRFVGNKLLPKTGAGCITDVL